MKWIAGLAGLALVALPAGRCLAQQSYGTAQRSNGTQQNQQAGTAQSLEAQAQQTIELFLANEPPGLMLHPELKTELSGLAKLT